MTVSSTSSEEATIKYVCGVDIGSQSCTGCICRPDKSIVVKSMPFANAREGWQIWEEKLSQLDAPPPQILIGMEATSCYHENLYHELEQRGSILRLLHPRQTHQFHERQGLRAKTDRLDARTIARVLLSGEARAGYVPSEQVATYRELVRLHTHLSDEAAAYQNEIQALVVVLFPEFTRIFADPCGQTALAVLKAFPSAQAIVAADVEPLFQLLRAQKPAHYGRPTAQKLVALAKESASSGRAIAGRSLSLRILCDQLEHTQANLARLNTEIEQLLNTDPGVKGLQQVPEFGPKTLAVLRAELGDVQRFSRTDEVIAYGGMDIEIKESGLWKGKAKLSKRGSGLLRRVLYMTALRSIHREDSAFGVYYQRQVARGLKTGSALMAVMRKMLAVAAHLLMHEGEKYDPNKVCGSSAG
ncbi:IS110 family transposase [Ktedonobacter racemifer]|nr:IS110 family transposase [Ktedonobacter racemifer]